MDDKENKLLCPGCSVELKEPYIRCAECPQPIKICLKCFGQGFEFASHQNNHSYSVVVSFFLFYCYHKTAYIQKLDTF